MGTRHTDGVGGVPAPPYPAPRLSPRRQVWAGPVHRQDGSPHIPREEQDEPKEDKELDQQYHLRLMVEEAVEVVYYSSDEELLERFAVHMCSLCEARQEDAICYCQECGDYLCSKCRKAHSKRRMTRGHTVREVGATVFHHHRKDAAEGREVKASSEGNLVREDGEPSSGETQEEPGLTTGPAAAVTEAPSGPGWTWLRTLVADQDHDVTGHSHTHEQHQRVGERGCRGTR